MCFANSILTQVILTVERILTNFTLLRQISTAPDIVKINSDKYLRKNSK